MKVKEILANLSAKGKERKELVRQLDERLRAEKMVQERQLSSNERELNRYYKEEHEKEVKKQLEVMRKRRDDDINFAHNPLDTPNITNHTEWEVLKEKNQFTHKGNMFVGHEANVLKNNNKLLKNNKKLYGI